jgi:NAD dependent epimerase/dehydratase family enzyme
LFLIELDKEKKNKAGKEWESTKAKIVNITSPQPVKSKEIVNILVGIKNKKVVNLPQKILSLMLGKDFVRETITPSQKVYPKVLISEGFEFLFPDIKKALEDIAK